jgi:hypothetical protein
MRVESSVTSISWIPREAVEGLAGVAFDIGLAHYDSPPPPVLEDLDAMRKADRFRFANELRAWVEVVDGGIVDYWSPGTGIPWQHDVKDRSREHHLPGCGVTRSSSNAGG